MCHLRDRPSEGGIVERPFGTTRAFALKLETENSHLRKRKPVVVRFGKQEKQSVTTAF
jgi:hypothetical protein